MSFKKKIDMLLEAKQLDGLTINKIEQLLRKDGTIYKAHKDDRYPKDSELVLELIRKFRIKQSWWDKDWETGSLDMFEEKTEPGNILTDYDKNPMSDNPKELFREVVMGDTPYVIMPKTAFEGKYRLTAIEYIAQQEKELERKNDELVRKDAALARRDEEIISLHEMFRETTAILASKPNSPPEVKNGKKKTGV